MIQLRGPINLPTPVRVEAPGQHELSWLEVDLCRLERNVGAIRHVIGEPDMTALEQPGDAVERPLAGNGARSRPRPIDRRMKQPIICGIVKKNAYGLGADQIAPRLVKSGCDMLAVYSADEAEHLIHKAVMHPILILMPMHRLSRTDALYRHAVAGKLHFTIHDSEQLKQLNQLAQTFGMRLPIHLYLDTGISRAGLNAQQFRKVAALAMDCPHLKVAGVYTHFATADSDPAFADGQFERFERLITEVADQLPPQVMFHAAGTFAMLRDARFHLDMVRPGLALYGYGPELLAPGPIVSDCPQFEPVARWLSRIIHVQRYPRRTPVGYNATFKLKRDSVLGTVSAGYADGYPLALSNKAEVRVFVDDPLHPVGNARVLGKVNMDQIVIDLTDLLSDGDEPRRLHHAIVELYSNDPAAPNAVPTLASMIKSHPYEMICRINTNVPRRYFYR